MVQQNFNGPISEQQAAQVRKQGKSGETLEATQNAAAASRTPANPTPRVSAQRQGLPPVSNAAAASVAVLFENYLSLIPQPHIGYDKPKGFSKALLNVLCPPTDFFDARVILQTGIFLFIHTCHLLTFTSCLWVPAWLWLIRHQTTSLVPPHPSQPYLLQCNATQSEQDAETSHLPTCLSPSSSSTLVPPSSSLTLLTSAMPTVAAGIFLAILAGKVSNWDLKRRHTSRQGLVTGNADPPPRLPPPNLAYPLTSLASDSQRESALGRSSQTPSQNTPVSGMGTSGASIMGAAPSSSSAHAGNLGADPGAPSQQLAGKGGYLDSTQQGQGSFPAVQTGPSKGSSMSTPALAAARAAGAAGTAAAAAGGAATGAGAAAAGAATAAGMQSGGGKGARVGAGAQVPGGGGMGTLGSGSREQAVKSGHQRERGESAKQQGGRGHRNPEAAAMLGTVRTMLIHLERVLFGNELTQALLPAEALPSRISKVCEELGIPFSASSPTPESMIIALKSAQKVTGV